MKIAATVLILFSSLHLASAQAPQDQQKRAVFDSFHRAIADLTARLGPVIAFGEFQTETVQAIHEIQKHVQVLEFVIENQKQVPKRYLESLELDAEILKQLSTQDAKSEPERKRLSETLKEVESDLEIKADVVRRPGPHEVSLVEVLVHARKGDQEVGAYEVWYVPKASLSVPSRFKRFERLTSPSNPSRQDIAPGNYWIWLSKGSSSTDRTLASVGVHGEPKHEIDLVVP